MAVGGWLPYAVLVVELAAILGVGAWISSRYRDEHLPPEGLLLADAALPVGRTGRRALVVVLVYRCASLALLGGTMVFISLPDGELVRLVYFLSIHSSFLQLLFLLLSCMAGFVTLGGWPSSARGRGMSTFLANGLRRVFAVSMPLTIVVSTVTSLYIPFAIVANDTEALAHMSTWSFWMQHYANFLIMAAELAWNALPVRMADLMLVIYVGVAYIIGIQLANVLHPARWPYHGLQQLALNRFPAAYVFYAVIACLCVGSHLCVVRLSRRKMKIAHGTAPRPLEVMVQAQTQVGPAMEGRSSTAPSTSSRSPAGKV